MPIEQTEILSHTNLTGTLPSQNFTCLVWTLLGFSGTADNSLADQLSTCTAQITTLLNGMGNAIACVTHAELKVTRCLPGPSRHHYLHDISGTFSSASTEDVSHLPAAMFAMLAARLPLLQHLSLVGYCEYVPLGVFGLRCPHLRSLQIDALQTQLGSLEHLHQSLPILSHFTLSNRGPLDLQSSHTYYYYIFKCVDSCFELLQKCKNLKILQLDLWAEHRFPEAPVLVIECAARVWDCLPQSVDVLRCDVKLTSLPECLGFTSRVRVLHLADLDDFRLPEFLKLAPCLQKLTVEHGQTVEVMWKDEDISFAELAVLKARLLHSFQLSCDSVSFTGSSVAVCDMLTWLLPLTDTTCCDIVFTDIVHDLDMLDQLPRVFPNLVHMSFVDATRGPYAQVIDARILRALAEVTSLKSIGMRLQLGNVGMGLE